MRISRIVSTDFWEDGLVTDSFSPEDKYFMLYLMTNPHSKQAGIYKLNKKIAAFEMGYSAETVSALLDRFEHKYHRIIYSSDTQEIAVLNAPKYNIVKGGKPVLDCVEKDLSEVKDKSLIARMYQHLKAYFEQSDKPSIQQIGEVWKKSSNNFKEVNEIENDNDNDRIVDVSYDESSHESLEEETDEVFLDFPLQDGSKYSVTESMIGIKESDGTMVWSASLNSNGKVNQDALNALSLGGITASTIIDETGNAQNSLKLGGVSSPTIIDGSGNAQNALKLGGNDAGLFPMFSTGIWTPTLYGSTTAGTISSPNMTGSYYKFGKLVYVAAGIAGTPSSAAGAARIGGVPFPIDVTVLGSNVGKTKRSALVDAVGVLTSTELNFWLGANEVNMTSLNGQSLNIGFSIWYVSTI